MRIRGPDAFPCGPRDPCDPVATLTQGRQCNRTFFGALEVERNVMFLILSLIVVVATLNIVSGLIMLVKDKGRDIAILRTMGAGRGAVLRIFLLCGAVVGGIGTLAGLAGVARAQGNAVADTVADVRVAVRSGEFTPYANVILHAGVAY